jgi:hypothetical protein
MGLIVGGLFTIFALLGAAIGAGANEPGAAFLTMFFGAGAIVFLPIMYGVMGFVGGVIAGALYNAVARMIGGITLELQEDRLS